jgi:hypothetical protein
MAQGCRAQPPVAPSSNGVETSAGSPVGAMPSDAATAPIASDASDASTVGARAPAAGDGPCAPLVARSNAARAGLPSPSRALETIESFGRCQRTRRGLWAIVLDGVRADPEDESTFRGSWSFVHVDAEGREVRVRRDETWQDILRPELTTFALFDYDNDGEEELVWSVRTNVTEGADGLSAGVMTFAQGAIRPLRGTEQVAPDSAEDVDRDGRPDLIVHAPYDSEGDDTPSGFPYNMRGPALVLHALADGTFSRDDAVAQEFARRGCAARVPAVFPASGEFEGAPAVACARLWGVPAASVRAAIGRRCQGVSEASSGRDSPRARCGDVRVLRSWVDLAPPLSLR